MTRAHFKEVKKVLTWVKKQIRANPKAYNQSEWCGTSCCIAGWIDKKISGKEAENHMAHEASNNAAIFLTGSCIEPRLVVRGMSLFSGLILSSPIEDQPKRGTKAYAEAGCKAIDAYLEQEEYRVVD